MGETSAQSEPLKTVVIAGQGNTGSQAAEHAARNEAVDQIILVDPDRFSARNVLCQACLPEDVGKHKAIVMARRVRRIRRNRPLHVRAIVDRVENVPLGWLRGSVLMGCTDSRISRAALDSISWALGMPLIDCGIQAGGSLARVEVHIPAADAACIQCAWGSRDVELLAESFSCDGRLREPAPTGASSALGGVAASLAVMECAKLLSGQVGQSLSGRQVVIEGKFYNFYLNTLKRNPNCRFDHQIWSIHKAPDSVLTVGDLFDYGRTVFGGDRPAALSGARKAWVRRLACLQCGRQACALRLQGRIGRKASRCRRCGGEMAPMGFYTRPRLELATASARLLCRPLRKLGLGDRDVMALTGGDGTERHVELSMANKPGGM